MAEDVQSNIRINIDSADALANLKNLQRQISVFQEQMSKSNAAMQATASKMQGDLINSINRTGQFNASIKTIKSTTESFTESLEKNKFSIGEYFRYAGGASKTFGRLFKSEFDTIEKVARENVKTLQTQYIRLGRDASGALKAIAVRPLTLDMQNLGTQTAMAAQKQALMNQLLKQGSTQLLNWGKNTQWAGRQLMVGFTVPLTMLGSVASKTFMDMEQQVVRFKRVYGDMTTMTADTDRMAASIKQLATEYTKYGVAVADTMGMAADAAAMGKQGADLLAQVSEAARLSVLGGVDQQKALQTTTSLTNAFGISATQLAGKINFLNAVENQTVTSIDDLTTAIPKAAPVVKQLGGSVEDLAFFLTAMKEGGINASEGANAIKSGLSSMINPTKKASEFLAGFGVNLKGIVEANKGDIKGTVVEFAKALDTIDPLNRARAIEQLFGKFQFARISTLFQNVIKDGSQAQTVLGLTKATTEELAVLSEREMKKIESSPMYKFQKAIEDIKVSLMPLGEAFLKAITPIIQFGTKALNWFNSLNDGVKGFITTFAGIAGVIAPALIMGVGLIANGFANVLKIFTFFKTRLNGTTNASSELTTQTSYMTQAQLQSAAVAASLDQTHQRLTQQFTSETAAVIGLRNAYTSTTAAQAAFANSNSGMANTSSAVIPDGTGKRRGTWKGLATGGIVRGPGTGTSDSIPAMLSDGEAVIPADKTRKYGPLINGIIDGKVQGFAEGKYAKGITESDQTFLTNFTSIAGKSVAGWLERELGKVRGRGFVENPEKTAQALKEFATNLIESNRQLKSKTEAEKIYKNSEEGKAIRGQYSRNANAEDRIVFAHGATGKTITAMQGVGRFSGQFGTNVERLATVDPEAKINLRGGFGVNVPQALNNLFTVRQGSGGASLADLRSYVSGSKGTDIFKTSIGIGGGNADKLSGEAEAVKNEFDRLLKESLDHGKTLIVDSEDDIAKIRVKSGKEAAEQYASLETILQQARRNTAETAPKINKVFDIAENTVTEGRGPEPRGWLSSLFPKLFNGKKYDRSMGGSTVAYRREGGAGATLDQFTNESGNGPVLRDPTEAEKSGKIDAAAYEKGRADVLAKKDSFVSTRDRNSPHRLAGPDGADDAKAYTQARDAELKKAGDTYTSGLLPPPPMPAEDRKPFSDPNDPFAPMEGNPFENYEKPEEPTLKDKAKGLAGAIGSKALEVGKEAGMGLLEKIWMGTAGKKIAQARGEIVTNSKGKVIYDPEKDLAAEEAKNKVNDKAQANTEQMLQNAEDALLANDAMYVQLEKESQIYKQKKEMGQASAVEDQEEISRQQKMSTMRETFVNDPANRDLVDPDIIAKNKNKAKWRRISGRTSLGLGAAAGIAGMVSAIPGMDSGVAKTLQNGAAAVGAAASVMQMIPGPAGMVAGGLTAVVTVAQQMQAAMDEVRAKAQKMAVALGSGKEAMDKLSAFAGTVNPTDAMNKVHAKERAGYNIVTGKNTFGGQYVASDAGKELLAQATEAKMSKGAGNAAKDIGIQLSQGIASGVITKAQAMSISNNLGEAMKDYSFAVNVNAEMQSLIGPSGEDLTKDPLQVKTKLIEEKAATTSVSGGAKDVINTKEYGLFTDRANYTEVAAAEVEYAQTYKDIVDMGKQNIDSLDLEHKKKLEALNLAKDEKGILAENAKYAKDRAALTDSNSKALKTENSYMKGLEKGGYLQRKSAEQIVDNLENSLQDKFKDADQKVKDMANLTIENISDNPKLAFSTKATLVASMTVENMDLFKQVQTLFPVDSHIGLWNKIAKIGVEMGAGAEEQLLAFLPGFKDAGKANSFTNYVINLKTSGDTQGAQDALDTMTALSKVKDNMGNPISLDQYIDAKGNATDKFKTLTKNLKDVNALIDKNKGKKAKYGVEFENKGFKLSKGEIAYFNSLSADQQKIYTTTFLTVKDSIDASTPEGKARIAAYKQAHGMNANTPAVMTDEAAIQGIAEEAANQRTQAQIADLTKGGPKTPPGGGGSGTNPINDLLNRLKMVRDASINAAGGIKELQRVLGANGQKNLTMFKGIEQNLVNRNNIMPGFMDFYNGLDDAAKKTYVKITGHGNKAIARLTEKGRLVNKALSEIGIGDFENNQVKTNQSLKNQAAAFANLRKEGMSYKDALEMSKNEELANSLAIAGSSAEIKKIIALEKERQSLEDPKTKFDKLMSQAQEKLSAQKNIIEIDFKVKESSFNKTVTDAQNEIAKLTNQAGGLDDLQAGLTQIGWAEDEINKKYDERSKALDKIESANAKISEQQKGQLTLAEALTRGDISAAASAMQDARSKAAGDAIANQKAALEASKQAEIDGLTANVNGKAMTKKDIDAAILLIQKQIFDIEEKRLEPAQEQIRLLEVEKAAQLAAITEQEDKWTALQAQVQLAITAGYDLEAAYLAAAAAAAQIKIDAGASTSTPTNANGFAYSDTTPGSSGSDTQFGSNTPWAQAVAAYSISAYSSNRRYSKGGIIPKYFAAGGFAVGTDTVPAMLTPGEFIMTKHAVDSFGVDNLRAINNGSSVGDSVYNYNLSVNMSGSNLNPNDVARAVMTQIKQIDSQRLRGNRI